jgi:hypothetical protein
VTATRWRRGFTHLIPFAAGHELLRQRRSELELIRMTPDVLYNQMIGMRRASITLRISSPDPEVEAACDEVQFGSTKPFVACNELHPEQQTETSVYVAAYVAGVPRIRGPRDAARPLDAGRAPRSHAHPALFSTWATQAAYLQADSTERRLFNQALFETIAIDTEEIDGHELAPPFAQLATLNNHYEMHEGNGHAGGGTKKRTPNPAKVGGSDVQLLVGLTGHLSNPSEALRELLEMRS